jgi:hypothetical protein
MRYRVGCQNDLHSRSATLIPATSAARQGLGGAHNLGLQPGFSGADWMEAFASASSARFSAQQFNALARRFWVNTKPAAIQSSARR